MIYKRLVFVVIYLMVVYLVSVRSLAYAQDTQDESTNEQTTVLDTPLIVAILSPVVFILLEFFFLSAVEGQKAQGKSKFRLHLRYTDGKKTKESPVDFEMLLNASRAKNRKLIDIEELVPPLWETSFGINLLVAAISGQIANFSLITDRIQQGEVAYNPFMDFIVVLIIAKFLSGFIIVNVIKFAKERENSWPKVLSIQLSNILGFTTIFLSYRILLELATLR